MPGLATLCPTRQSPPRTPPGFPETIQKKGMSKEDFEKILNDDLNEMKKVDISSQTLDYRNVSPTTTPFSNPMCNNRFFTMHPHTVLSPKISQNTDDYEHLIGKNGESESQIEVETNKNLDILEVCAKKEEDKNENQKVEKKLMTAEQEPFLEQFSKIVLGTWRPKQD